MKLIYLFVYKVHIFFVLVHQRLADLQTFIFIYIYTHTHNINNNSIILIIHYHPSLLSALTILDKTLPSEIENPKLNIYALKDLNVYSIDCQPCTN